MPVPFDELIIPRLGRGEDDMGAGSELPKGYEELTDAEKVAALNMRQAEMLGDDVTTPGPDVAPMVKAKVEVKPKKVSVSIDHVEYLDDEAKAAPKAKEVRDTQRGQGFAKQEVAKAIGVVSVGGVVAENIGAIEPTGQVVQKYSASTIGWVFAFMIALAVLYYYYGQWQEQKGRDEADSLMK